MFLVFFLKVVDLLLGYHSHLVRQIPHLVVCKFHIWRGLVLPRLC